jgi:hypothetical protein
MHTKNIKFNVLTILVLLSMLLASCAPAAPTAAPEAPAAEKTHRLALIQFLKGHPVHRIMQLGFE